jgi:hypothetical protein
LNYYIENSDSDLLIYSKEFEESLKNMTSINKINFDQINLEKGNGIDENGIEKEIDENSDSLIIYTSGKKNYLFLKVPQGKVHSLILENQRE